MSHGQEDLFHLPMVSSSGQPFIFPVPVRGRLSAEGTLVPLLSWEAREGWKQVSVRYERIGRSIDGITNTHGG
jgi:hypothetical protein